MKIMTVEQAVTMARASFSSTDEVQVWWSSGGLSQVATTMHDFVERCWKFCDALVGVAILGMNNGYAIIGAVDNATAKRLRNAVQGYSPGILCIECVPVPAPVREVGPMRHILGTGPMVTAMLNADKLCDGMGRVLDTVRNVLAEREAVPAPAVSFDEFKKIVAVVLATHAPRATAVADIYGYDHPRFVAWLDFEGHIEIVDASLQRSPARSVEFAVEEACQRAASALLKRGAQ
jgi:hypothetical protein